MQIRHILYPSDFSELSVATEPYVKRMAEHFGAAISVLHTIELPSTYFGVPGDFFLETVDAEKLQEQAEKAIESVLRGLQAERMVRIGDPATLITEFAELNNVDLIMMPTHGYGPFRRALIGSVTAKVLHDAICPVWTTAHAEEPVDECTYEPTRMICAIDLVPESLKVVRTSADLAQNFGAKLWLAHAVTPVHTVRDEFAGPPADWALNLQDYYFDFARREVAKIQAQAGTEFGVCLEAGVVSAVMAEVARKHKANLVITGRGEMRHFLGNIRSHEYSIIQESPCPVLSL